MKNIKLFLIASLMFLCVSTTNAQTIVSTNFDGGLSTPAIDTQTQGNVSAGTSFTMSLTTSTANEEAVIAINVSGSTVSSVVNTTGTAGAWSLVKAQVNGTDEEIWKSDVATTQAAVTITVNLAGSSTAAAVMNTFKGVFAVTPIEANTAANLSATTAWTASVTTAQAGSLVAAYMGSATSNTMTAGSGYTAVTSSAPSATATEFGEVKNAVVATGAATAAAATMSGNSTGVEIAISLKAYSPANFVQPNNFAVSSAHSQSGSNSLSCNSASGSDLMVSTSDSNTTASDYSSWNVFFTSVGAGVAVGATVRCNSSASNANGYMFLITTNTGVSISKRVTSANTQISVNVGSGSTFSTNTWYTMTCLATGNHIVGRVQRVSDGFWLNSAGTFAAPYAECSSVIDYTWQPASGYFSGLRNSSAANSVYFDDQNYSQTNILVSSPVQYQTLQRSAGGTASIAITGTYFGSPTSIVASWNGNPQATIVASPSAGSYTGTLTAQPYGQGNLTITSSSDASSYCEVPILSIGDVWIIAGQSNGSGRCATSQTPLQGLLPTMFGNDYLWKLCTDNTDSSTNQVDTVSSDPQAAGSVWPIVASSLAADTGVPQAIIQTCLGGTLISQWQPGGSGNWDRTTLFGSMAYRASSQTASPVTGTCKAVLWWQGESDQQAGTSQATYTASMASLASAIKTDLGVNLVPCKLTTAGLSWASAANQQHIQDAIGAEWASDTNVTTGPDLSGINTNDEDSGFGGSPAHVHIIYQPHESQAALLWVRAIEAAFYPVSSGSQRMHY